MVERRPFSLIEMLVALTLGGALLSLLLGLFWRVHQTHPEIDALEQQVYSEYALQQRLADILPKIQTLHDELAFTFSNGIDEEPTFCATILGRLYLDQEQRLILATWPSPFDWELENLPYRTEQLYDQPLHSIRFLYYDPPTWETTWEKEELPTMIRLEITTHDGRELRFTHSPLSANKPIRYYKQ